MGRKNAKNPRRIPATKADVERAKRAASDEAVEAAMVLIFSAALDRCGMSAEDVKRLYLATNDVADSVVKGYATMAELKWTLRTEAGITFDKAIKV